MNRRKGSKAITLIALIITIIILLVLAGVVINMTIGNDGIITKAQSAVDTYKNAQEKEIATINEYSNYIDVQSYRNIDVDKASTEELKAEIARLQAELDESRNIVNNYISDDIKEILDNSNKRVEMQDVLTTNFCSKISTSKTAAKLTLDNSTFRNNVSIPLLSALNVSLVPALSNNTNVLCNSIYSSSWDAYMAFSSSSCWCTLKNQVSNIIIGYKFNQNFNVRIVKLYNGGTQGYPAKQVKLQCSSDNETWIDASDVYTLSNSCYNAILFNTKVDAPYQYWRIYILNSYKSDYIEINNIQFYGV